MKTYTFCQTELTDCQFQKTYVMSLFYILGEAHSKRET